MKLPANVPWETFKKDVHQFGVDLHTLLEKDTKGAYYHIEALRKNAAVYNTLAQMNQKLQQEQKTAAPDQPALKLGKQTAQSLVRGINLYAHAFYQQKLIEQLKGLFKGFEEQAKKLRTAEEGAQKTAEGRPASGAFDDFDFDYGEIGTDFGVDFGTDTGVEDFSDWPEVTDVEPSADTELKESDIGEIDWGF